MTMFVIELTRAAVLSGAPDPVITDFQQTPHDPLYGDMLVGTTRFFAIEFKRLEKESHVKESQKWNTTRLSHFLNSQDDAWKSHQNGWAMAQVCHLLVSGCGLTVTREIHVSRSPYMPAIFPKLKGCKNARSRIVPLPVLASSLLKATSGASPQQIYRYLVKTAPCRRSMNGTEGEGGATMIVAKLRDGRTVVTTNGCYVEYCKLLDLASMDKPNIVRTIAPAPRSRQRKMRLG